VVVSGAAGATGAAAAQIARIAGCRVIGIAGGPEKCRYLVDELGLDGAVDYKSENLARRLRELCPSGIDVFFDNVGGPALDVVLLLLALRGRIVICGGISHYNEARPASGPANYLALISKRGRMEGFLVLDYLSRAGEAVAALSGWMRDGKLKDRVDVMDGLENAPAALLRVFEGRNRGKQLVKLASPPPAP
jgi:NADPH-dependent curcumin reductase CurA